MPAETPRQLYGSYTAAVSAAVSVPRAKGLSRVFGDETTSAASPIPRNVRVMAELVSSPLFLGDRQPERECRDATS